MTYKYHYRLFWGSAAIFLLVGLRALLSSTAQISVMCLTIAFILFGASICESSIQSRLREAAPYRQAPTQLMQKLTIEKSVFCIYMGSAYGLIVAMILSYFLGIFLAD